ncbi:MAG: hypothetical protein R6V59_05400 [Dehalococcoidia bacterium]
MAIRKYWRYIFTIFMLLVLAIVVQVFKEKNDVAAWIFSFISDWSVITSAVFTLVLALAAFLSIKEIRKDRRRNRNMILMGRIRNWALSMIEFFREELSLKPDFDILDVARRWALVIADTPTIVMLSRDFLEEYKDDALDRLVGDAVQKAYKLNSAFKVACDNQPSAQQEVERDRTECEKALWQLLSGLSMREAILS